MGRRRQNDEGGVSLFPFMSILACLIGILTLMISVTMITNQAKKEGMTEEEFQLAEENRDLKRKIEELKKKRLEADERLKKEKKTVVEMKKLEERSLALQMKFDDLKKSDRESDSELQKVIENLMVEAKAIEREQPSLQKMQKQLLVKLKERKDQPKPKESVIVRPGGIGTDVPDNLFFIECSSTGIVLRKSDGSEIKVSTSAISRNDEFSGFCEKVKTTEDSMILFLVRKGGKEAYLWAAGTAESKFEVRTGKLPVPNEGKIDLSLFNK